MADSLDADRFLEDLSGRYARAYFEALDELMVAIATGDRELRRVARERLREVIAETMGVGEILGASLALKRAAAELPKEKLFRADSLRLLVFADVPVQTILPRVTFEEAVQDMVDRTPVTIRRAAERTAQRIAQLYGERRVVAFVESAEAAVTRRAQELISEAIREGIPEADAARRIVRSVAQVRRLSAPWTEGYARMSFRTNVNTAVTAGRFRQARDPDIKAVIPAFRFDSVGDADTRPNHDAADGVILRVDNIAWNRIAPPLGYNCRCQVSLVSLAQLKRMGRVAADGSVRESRVPAAAGPDLGFRHGGRPDLFIAEGARV